VAIVVEVGPVHRDDDFLARTDDEPRPGRQQVPQSEAAVAQQAVDLLDPVLRVAADDLAVRFPDRRDRQSRRVQNADHAVGQRLHSPGMEVVSEYPSQRLGGLERVGGGHAAARSLRTHRAADNHTHAIHIP